MKEIELSVCHYFFIEGWIFLTGTLICCKIFAQDTIYKEIKLSDKQKYYGILNFLQIDAYAYVHLTKARDFFVQKDDS